MAKLSDIVCFLDETLNSKAFVDTSLNGLQIEASSDVQKVAVTVDAALETVRMAIKRNAHLLIAHHGLMWENSWAIVGAKRELVQGAFEHGLNVYASHLPLDAHVEYGNNFCLARLLQLSALELAFDYHGQKIGCLGTNTNKLSLADFEKHLLSLPGTSPILTLPFGPKIPERVGFISGSGAAGLYEFKKLGFDTFITGETRQTTYHFARENNLNVIFAGHYRTETIGVMELGKLLQKQFSVSWEFIDCPTGI